MSAARGCAADMAVVSFRFIGRPVSPPSRRGDILAEAALDPPDAHR